MGQYTPYLTLELPDHGEYPNTWEVPANANFLRIDQAFHGFRSDEPNGYGHVHDGTAGQGPKLKHDQLLHYDGGGDVYVPVYRHEEIDEHIADAAQIHFPLSSVILTVNDQDAAGAGGTVEYPVGTPSPAWTNGPYSAAIITELRFPAAAVSSPSPGVVVIDTSLLPSGGGGTGPGVGVPTHLPSTHAPVAVTDLFHGDELKPLSQGNWWVSTDAVELLVFADAAQLTVDTAQGGPASGRVVNRVKAQVPHSEVQRVTASLCRVGTDDFVTAVDTFSFQLALMSSAFLGTNVLSRLGFFFKLDVFKQAQTIYLTRTLYAVPTVNAAGISVATVLWTDTGPASDYRHYQGVHEFALDRNHAFHYYYNNGPVNLGSAGQPGAATPFLATLVAQLSAEFTLFPQSSAPLGVAPQYGRFGFDVAWAVPAGGALDASVEYFTATGLDDESAVYSAVKKGGDCGAVMPVFPPTEPCCTAIGDIVPPTIEPGMTIPGPPLPGGGGGGGGDTDWRVVEVVSEGDAEFEWRGFVLKEVGYETDPAAPRVPIFCEAMSALIATDDLAPRSGASARIIVSGDRIPGLVELTWRPTAAATALPLPLPAGAGSYTQALPYPVPAQPGTLDLTTPDIVVGVWPEALPLDDRVFKNVAWFRRADGALEISFDVADGVPVGFAADLTVTSGLYAGNSAPVTAAVVVRPGAPAWFSADLYQRSDVGAFTAAATLEAGRRAYLAARGRRLPLPITPAGSPLAAQTLWSGFPIDPTAAGAALLDAKYLLVDLDDGSVLDIESLSPEGVIYKGRHETPPAVEFPPANSTPVDETGETLFLSFDVPADLVGRRLALRAVETADATLPVADILLPDVTASVPRVVAVTVSPDTTPGGTPKTFVVDGTGFDAVTITATSANTSFGSLVAQSATQLTFTGTVTAGVTAVFRITNTGGLYVDVSLLFGSVAVPTVVSVVPATLTAGAVGVTFTVQGTGFDVGAAVGAPPLTDVRQVGVDAGADTATFIADVPATAAGSSVAVTVTNPNGNVSTPFAVPITAPPKPCPLLLTFYASAIDYAVDAANARGREVGAAGLLRITGTGFVDGVTLSTDVPTWLRLGAATVVSSVEMTVGYSLAAAAPVGASAQLIATHPDGLTSGTLSFVIEEPTPIVLAMSVTNQREGAGHAAAPAQTARVLISGRSFFRDGASNIASVAVTTGNGSVPAGEWSATSDTLLVIDRLVLDADTADETCTIRLTTIGGKFVQRSFVIRPHLVPSVVSWTVAPAPGGAALDPLVVPEGAANHVITLYGSELAFADYALTGPFVGGPVVVKSATYVTITLPTIDANVTGDPTVRLAMTPYGTTTQYSFDLFLVDTSDPGAPTVSAVDAYALYEASRAAEVVIVGTNLTPKRVGRVEFVAADPADLPVSVRPLGTRDPIRVTIVEQTATRITARLDLADNLAELDFDLRLKAPDGSTISIAPFTVTPESLPNRPALQRPLPALSIAVGNANDVTYTVTDPLGGEYVEVYNAEDEELNLTRIATLTPATIRVTFDMPSVSGTEVELRFFTAAGVRFGVHRATALS